MITRVRRGFQLFDIPQGLGGNLTGYFPALQDKDAFADSGDETEILLHQQDGQAASQSRFLQCVGDFVDDRRLNAFRRLVEKDDPRIAAEASCQGQQLLFSAGKRPAAAIEIGFQTREKVEDFGQCLGFRPFRQAAAYAKIVQHAQSGKYLAPLWYIADAAPRERGRRCVRHLAPGKCHLAARGRQMARDGSQQRGFAHAVMPENADALARLDGQAQALKDGNASVAGSQLIDAEKSGIRRRLRMAHAALLPR